MISEEQKYRAEVSKIVGFALMAPFGRAVTDPYLFKDFDPIIITFYIVYTLILLIFGLGLILEGCDILNIKRRI